MASNLAAGLLGSVMPRFDPDDTADLSSTSSYATVRSLPDEKPTAGTGLPSTLTANADFLASPQAQELATKVGCALQDHDVSPDDPVFLGKRPISLIDLPVDVLEVIVREIGSTNDLTALALTHSALHTIVIPQMYSRFDIVWPDAVEENDVRVGVDALAYGLGTLAMSGNIRGFASQQSTCCKHCGCDEATKGGLPVGARNTKRKLENYAQFTRKFSLGNGPLNFVQSYYISTESGKMLGTLVALAVSRMRNLETFIWDMPTGIVREVWEALASLGHSQHGSAASTKLESVWVRCHDSKQVHAPSQNLHFFLGADGLSARHGLLLDSFRQIEHPNFSILPPLRSISVLQIDQIAYFEELSILVNRSIRHLRELRIGIGRACELAHQHVHESVNGAESTFLGESSLTALGANGVLGMLMSKFCECVRQPLAAPARPMVPFENMALSATEASLAPPLPPIPSIVPGVPLLDTPDYPQLAPPGANFASPFPSPISEVEFNSLHSSYIPERAPDAAPYTPEVDLSREHKTADIAEATASKKRFDEFRSDGNGEKKLKLQVLALENIPLSISVLCKAIEWSFLTDITLLHCNSDENLWKALAKVFTAKPKTQTDAQIEETSTGCDYPLRLRKIHTDGVSAALITFIRDNLAPNTLECLFLQNRPNYKPSAKVSIDSIYKGALRRHRGSLQKLSIDSAFKPKDNNACWKKWLLNRDVLSFLTSGKMVKLRELAVSVEYKDWHYLLQHLPGLPRLRSLYVPFVNEHVHADPQELALQILDIVTLRPEIELCYLGILDKCFEILEGKRAAAGMYDGRTPPLPQGSEWGPTSFLNHEESDDSSVSSVDDGDDDDDDDEGDDDDDSDDSDDTDSDAESSRPSSASGDEASHAPRLRLREILFFAEKVEIFKVRHGTI